MVQAKVNKNGYWSKNKSNFLWLLLFVILAFAIMYFDLKSVLVSDLKVGSISEFDIKAPQTITYVTGANLFLENLDSIFSLLEDYIKLPQETKEKNKQNLIIILKNQLEQNINVYFSEKELENVLFMDEKKLKLWKDRIKSLISKLSSGVEKKQFLRVQREMVMKIVNINEIETPFFVKITGYLARFIPQKKTIQKGEYVVKKGDILGSEQLLLLKKMQLLQTDKQKNWLKISGKLLMTLLLSILMYFYFYRYYPQIVTEKKLFFMVLTLLLLFLLITKAFYFLNFIKNITFKVGNYEIELFSPFFIPISCFSIIFTIMFDVNIAFVLTVLMSLFLGLIFETSSFVYVLYVLFSGWVASLVTSDFRERSQISRAGFLTSLVNVTVIILIVLLYPPFYEKRILILDIIWGALAGIISSIMAIGGLPFLEKIFNVTTSLKMLELIDFSQPLLQRLILDAPGTYHHSVIVSNLAEAAAREIGADALLCKVGGYYHDIGKLKRPYFFVENQTGQNVHDQLNPNLSALVIISHVKDGVALAKEYSLPESIVNIIREHHGTSLVTYFYDKATKEGVSNPGELEMKFRYPGVKPQTKESAIVMLADSIESAARTLKHPAANQIKNLVSRIINQKFEDGQLDDSNLTMKDLEKLERVFARILISMYHARIEYPEEIDRIIEENKKKAVEEEKNKSDNEEIR